VADATRMNRFAANVAAVRRLPWHDRWLLFQAGLLLPLLSLSLRFIGFRRTYSFLRRVVPGGNHPAPANLETASARVLQIAYVVAMASRHTPTPNSCLHRSLALWWLLRRAGFDSRVRFGARKQPSGFEAHAWVEHNGVVVFDDLVPDRDYIRLSWQPLEHDA
jgi:Transglutaminase-like superfamily